MAQISPVPYSFVCPKCSTKGGGTMPILVNPNDPKLVTVAAFQVQKQSLNLGCHKCKTKIPPENIYPALLWRGMVCL